MGFIFYVVILCKVTGFFSSWLGSLSLVVASVLLCTSFVVYDACQISEIVTRDFEPFVGDKVSPGANACFNRTQRLDEAFNVTEKVNFQAKLDEGLQLIETVNVTEKFQVSTCSNARPWSASAVARSLGGVSRSVGLASIAASTNSSFFSLSLMWAAMASVRHERSRRSAAALDDLTPRAPPVFSAPFFSFLLSHRLLHFRVRLQLVLEPLFDIQTLIGSISDSALSALNQATAQPNNALCPFTDMYTKETLLRPWSLDRLTENTTYVIRENRGSPTSYSRMGSEDGETYLERIYNKAGVCSAPSSCCIQYTMSPPATCLSNIYSDCDYGDNCVYACDILKNGIIEGYKAFLQLHSIEMAMTADLGVSCPTDKVDFDDTCPTQEFQSRYANLTLVGLLEGVFVCSSTVLPPMSS